MSQSNSNVIVSSNDLSVAEVKVSPKIELVQQSSPEKRRNKKKHDAPELLAISHNDKNLLTADRKGNVCVRSIRDEEETKDTVNWTICAHQDRVASISFVAGHDDLVATTSSNASDACNIWRVGADQPVAILDRPALISAVTAIGSLKVGKTIVVSCISPE